MKKIPTNLQYPLTVTSAKIVVPINYYDYEDAEQIFIIINHLHHTQKATLLTLKGYRRYLWDNLKNTEVLKQWRIKLVERYKLNLHWEYINLHELNQFRIKLTGNGFGFWNTIPIFLLFMIGSTLLE